MHHNSRQKKEKHTKRFLTKKYRQVLLSQFYLHYSAAMGFGLKQRPSQKNIFAMANYQHELIKKRSKHAYGLVESEMHGRCEAEGYYKI